jgi:hypothetical protein
MIQCSECEFYEEGPGGQAIFHCNPFTNIKEPECLTKWQLIKLDKMVQAYQQTLQAYKRLAPLQEKMFRHMEREVGEMDDAEQWKYPEDQDEDDPRPDLP